MLGGIINGSPTGSVTLGTNNSAFTAKLIASITVPVGIWVIAYQIRYYNNTGATNVTAMVSYCNIITAETNQPLNYGWLGNSNTTVIGNSQQIAVSTSFVFKNHLSQTMTLNDASNYTGTGSLIAYADGNTQTYFIATRIG
jgi:hypothetical protein